MYDEFWKEDSIFHTLRKEFVYKTCPTQTPQRLKYKKNNNAWIQYSTKLIRSMRR